MVNDLLDNNGCFVLLQSFDDVFTMGLFSLARGNKVSILAKGNTCINNILLRAKGCHVYGLEGDKTLYSMCLVTLQQNVETNKDIHPLIDLHHIHWNPLFPNLG
jgi:hypothetical protein